MLRVAALTTLEALQPWAAAWDGLAAGVPRPLVTRSHAWVASWLEHAAPPRAAWRVLVAHEGDRLAGVLPLAAAGGPLGGRRPRLRVPNDANGPAGDVLLHPEGAGATLAALLAAAEGAGPRPLSVDLGSVRDGGTTRAATAGPLGRWRVATDLESRGSSFPVAGLAVERWREGLSKNLRSDLRRAENRCAAEAGGPPVARFLAGAEAEPARLDGVLALEASGWKGREGTAVLCSPRETALWRAFTARLATRGWLEWHLLEIGGKAAAAHLACRLGRTVLLVKLGYDEALGRFSPGALLLARAVERAIASGDTEAVDFGTDYPWLRRWRTQVDDYHRVRLFPPGPLPWLLGRVPEAVRRRLKRVGWLRRLVRRTRGEEETP